jgi:hypothetical protein
MREGIQYCRVLTREGQQAYRALMFKKRTTLDLSLVRWCSMLTLTLDPRRINTSGLYKEGEPALSHRQLCYRYIMQVWKKFRARCWKGKVYKTETRTRLRQFRFKYLLVVEWTKAGIPHLHVLLDRYLPKGFVQKAWVESGGGPVLKFSYLGKEENAKRALLYTMKYICKALDDSCRGCRRWAYTRGLLPQLEKMEKDVETVFECVGPKEVARMNELYPTIIYGDEDGEEVMLAPCELAEALGLVYWADYPPIEGGKKDDRDCQR